MSFLTSCLVYAASASDTSPKNRVPERGTKAAVKTRADDYQRDLGKFHESEIRLSKLGGWRKPKRILITMAAAGIADNIAGKYKDVEIVRVAGAAPEHVSSGEFDAIIGYCGRSEQLPIDKHVRWVHSYSAGVEGCLENPAFINNPHILLTNSSGTSGAVIAEHTIGLMFSLGRGLNVFAQEQAAQRWSSQRVNRQEAWFFSGKTMLRLLAASSPTGPAFEGAQITSGQRAAPGAIERVRIDPETLEPREIAPVILHRLARGAGRTISAAATGNGFRIDLG